MKTEDLVAWLAADAQPVSHPAQTRRFLVTLALGTAVALLLMLVLLGPRPAPGAGRDAARVLLLSSLFRSAWSSPPPWPAGNALAIWVCGWAVWACCVAAPVAAIWLMSAIILMTRPRCPGWTVRADFGAPPGKHTRLILQRFLFFPASLAASWAARACTVSGALRAWGGRAAGLFAGAAGAPGSTSSIAGRWERPSAGSGTSRAY